MSVLGGIDLGSDIHIAGEHSIPRVDSIMQRTRDNSVIVWEQSAGAQAFDLVGMSNRGVLTKSKMDALYALASVPNASYTLEYEGETKTVRFRHWEGDVIVGEALGPREQMNNDDFYTGVKIKLMEV